MVKIAKEHINWKYSGLVRALTFITAVHIGLYYHRWRFD
jgi:hypothetical protein